MTPAAFVIYKGSAVLRLQLLPAKPRDEDSPYLQEGCIMLEMAKAKGEANERGNRTYDWDNKIIFKMVSKDIGDILAYMKMGAKKEVKLIHDSSKAPGTQVDDNKKYKSLYINADESGNKWFWSLSTSKEDRISCPIDTSEMVRMQQLLFAGVVKIYGW
jgi:hypothetical protein